MGIDLKVNDGALGAEVEGLDLSLPLTAAQAGQLRLALEQRMVLVFRDQHLDDQGQVRFTGVFGRPVEHVRRQADRPVKEIFLISNIKKDGQPIGALGDELIPFHSDLSYLERPGTVSVLYALEVPVAGGQTQWCDCRAAYDALGDGQQQRLRGLLAVHRHPVVGQNPSERVAQPVVRLHANSGRRSLYVSPHLTSHIVGMDQAASRDLLEGLYAHMDQPQFVWTHHWRVGDVVVWDNRPTMHRRLPFDPEQRRLMKRTQVFNEEKPLAG
jgi:taurine dioxygenase